MFQFLKRNKNQQRIKHPENATVYGYGLSPLNDADGGAGEFVFERPFLDPLIALQGRATFAGALDITSAPTIVLRPNPIIYGMPQTTEDITIQKASSQKQG